MKQALATLLIAAGLAVALTAATGWCLVAPGEVVVVRRFGRPFDPPWGPGLHWRLPLGMDRLDRVRSDAVRQVTIGLAAPAGSDREPSAGEVMTGDLNLLRFQATVQYRVARPVAYVRARRSGRAAARHVGRGERLTLAGGSRQSMRSYAPIARRLPGRSNATFRARRTDIKQASRFWA